MSKDTEFIKSFTDSIKQSVNTTAPAKVISYNSGSRTAAVQPLFIRKDSDGKTRKQSIIEDVPVPKHCKDDIKAGSLVFISYCERALDNLNGTNFIQPTVKRIHSVSDAIVVGVY